MKSITIKGSIRKELGKSSSKKLRNEGKVPCILYGDGEPIHFYSNEIDFKKLVYTPDAHTVNIELDEKNHFYAIMQDIQFHPLTDKIIHIDFYQLSEDKEVFGCLRRNNFVTILYKQKSNTVPGEFLGRLVLGVEDNQVKIFGATIY